MSLKCWILVGFWSIYHARQMFDISSLHEFSHCLAVIPTNLSHSKQWSCMSLFCLIVVVPIVRFNVKKLSDVIGTSILTPCLRCLDTTSLPSWHCTTFVLTLHHLCLDLSQATSWHHAFILQSLHYLSSCYRTFLHCFAYFQHFCIFFSVLYNFSSFCMYFHIVT